MSFEFLHPYESLKKLAEKQGSRPALKGHKFGRSVRDEPVELSWREVLERVHAYALWLRNQGLKKGDRVAIQGRNQISWVLTDWALTASGLVSVPIYVQSHETEINYILREADIRFLITDEVRSELSIPQVSFSDLEESSKAFLSQSFTPDLMEPDEVFTIIYTSGTTGEPKGVMHSLRNLSQAVQTGVNYLGVRQKDQLLSYLPLSHIAERMLCGFCPLYSGARVFYVESADKLSRALPLVQPTLFLAVPRVWDMFKAKLQRELEANALLQARLQAIPTFLRSWLLGMMIKRKLGFSRTRAFYSGAAKLHHETADYMSKLGIKIAELYGLTETMGLSLYNEARAPVRGSVGRAFPGVDLRLAEDGEICLRAPYHFLGYFKKPEMTAEVLREGWFYTGDIGEKSPEGFVKITDRKKDIFKTASGKYVAPLPIETLLKAHPAIKEVMVVGENKPHCVALACVESTLAQTEELLAHLEKVNAHLAIHEKIKTIGCMTRMWSVDQGELTPTLKLKRKQILKHYGDVIEELFETRSPIQMLDDDEKRKKAQC